MWVDKVFFWNDISVVATGQGNVYHSWKLWHSFEYGQFQNQPLEPISWKLSNLGMGLSEFHGPFLNQFQKHLCSDWWATSQVKKGFYYCPCSNYCLLRCTEHRNVPSPKVFSSTGIRVNTNWYNSYSNLMNSFAVGKRCTHSYIPIVCTSTTGSITTFVIRGMLSISLSTNITSTSF